MRSVLWMVVSLALWTIVGCASGGSQPLATVPDPEPEVASVAQPEALEPAPDIPPELRAGETVRDSLGSVELQHQLGGIGFWRHDPVGARPRISGAN